MKLSQIVITKTEEPIDAPRGIVYKVALFDSKHCVDIFYYGSENDAMDCIRSYLEDLDY